MSKKSRQKEHRDSKRQKVTQPTQPAPLRWIRRFWKLFAGISIVLTIIVSFLSLSPSIMVAPAQTLDLKNPMATPFVITNESLLPIHSVEILCGINKIYSSTMNSGVEKLSLGYAKPPIPILYHKEQNTFLCPPAFKFKTPIDVGDITIDI